MAADDTSAISPSSGPDLEQQNRSRNLLARLRSILSRMTETAPDSVDFAAHLDGRLSALWRAEEAFLRSGADLELMILDELQTFGAPMAAITLDGPELRLDSQAAGVMILALHELATNGVKFGALGRPDGQLAVSWRVTRDEHGSKLALKWEESGVSVVARAPRHEGFGYDLITRRIAYELGGTGVFSLNPGGVSCLIEIPLKG